jgi:hypothetical protein
MDFARRVYNCEMKIAARREIDPANTGESRTAVAAKPTLAGSLAQ